MFVHILSMQFAGFFGGDLGNLLASWEQMGVFSYVLPFLLIFAIVFGILSRTNIFGENKGLNAVVALVIGLLSLQFQLVPVFFSQIFPNLGVGLSIILIMMILLGLFIPYDKQNKMNYLLLGVAAIIFVIVVANSFSSTGYYGFSDIMYFIYAHLTGIVITLIVLIAIGAVIGSGGPKPKKYKAVYQQEAP